MFPIVGLEEKLEDSVHVFSIQSASQCIISQFSRLRSDLQFRIHQSINQISFLRSPAPSLGASRAATTAASGSTRAHRWHQESGSQLERIGIEYVSLVQMVNDASSAFFPDNFWLPRLSAYFSTTTAVYKPLAICAICATCATCAICVFRMCLTLSDCLVRLHILIVNRNTSFDRSKSAPSASSALPVACF